MKSLILLFVIAFCAVAQPRPEPGSWKHILNERLALYGHRNWIVVADSAYPLQSGPGIETILSNENQIETLRYVFLVLSKDTRVRPVVFVDNELSFVAEQDAVGITAYRQLLTGLFEKWLSNQKVTTIPHESIIQRLDDAGKTFNVLIIKTNMALPYTSVFLQLNAAYWGDAEEQRLRQAIPR